MIIEHTALALVKRVDGSSYFKTQVITEGKFDSSQDLAQENYGHDIEDNRKPEQTETSQNLDKYEYSRDNLISDEIIVTPTVKSHHRICTRENKDEADEKMDQQFSHHIHIHNEIKDANQSKALVKALILESSIAIHSIIIGFDLGVLSNQNLRSTQNLTIALCFHQLFEGLSLGTSIVQTCLKHRVKLLLSIMFAISLPTGIVIGIAVNGRLTEEGETIAAVASSFAAGSLLHSGFIEMIAEDFVDPYVQSNFTLKLKMFFSIAIGIGMMAVLAIWA